MGSVVTLATAARRPILERARAILEFLNNKAGKHFRPTRFNLGIIQLRMVAYSDDEIRQVVAMKTREWGRDPHMRQFLRPLTLFDEKLFDQYAGELDPSDE